MKTTKRICLWSGPRNISTAMMYSFAQRIDTRVYDEPLYAHYLSKTNANEYHPMAGEILATMENDGQKVVESMMGEHETEVVFFKNMTHHLFDLDLSFMKDTTNIILTRDPKEMLPSFDAVINQPSLKDVGYEMQTTLLQYFLAKRIEFSVIDSRIFLQNPESILVKLCKRLKIEFDHQMLKWSAGPRPEDGIWAKYWYKSVHLSNGFSKYEPKSDPFPDHLLPLLSECQPHYDELLKHAID